MNPTYDFKNQVVLVTGASPGLGLATAEAFARSGASVVLSSHDATKLAAATDGLAAAGLTVKAIACDVADEEQVAALVARTVEVFGTLDIAFNNAGIDGPHEPFTETTAEAFDQVNAINLRGVWACMKHELKHMEARGSGVIVNCSSLGGHVGMPERAAYHATKHGVLGLTKSVGLEYARRGIRVNTVSPGVFNTPMLQKMQTAKPDIMEDIAAQQPIGRLGKPEELAAAVLWLSSPASSFVIGASLAVDGGFIAQ